MNPSPEELHDDGGKLKEKLQEIGKELEEACEKTAETVAEAIAEEALKESLEELSAEEKAKAVSQKGVWDDKRKAQAEEKSDDLNPQEHEDGPPKPQKDPLQVQVEKQIHELFNTQVGIILKEQMAAIGRQQETKNQIQINWVRDRQAVDVRIAAIELTQNAFNRLKEFCWHHNMLIKIEYYDQHPVLLIRWLLPDVLPKLVVPIPPPPDKKGEPDAVPSDPAQKTEEAKPEVGEKAV